jgi:ABC-2 family transporter protein
MTWLAWRQFRVSAGVASVALAALAVVIVITGRDLVHQYDASGIAACQAPNSCAGALRDASFLKNYQALQQLTFLGLLAAPAIIGIFWGAPLIAREFETGTYRLAWTQSVSRTRWLAVKLGVVGVASVIAAGMLSFMVSWWSRPIDWVNANRFSPGTFDARGVVAIGYAAFAFTLGLAAGLVIRRTLAAMAASLTVFVAARLVMTFWLRAYLWTPAHVTTPLRADDVSFLLTPAGVTVAPSSGPAYPNAWVYSSHLADSSGHVPTQDALHAFLSTACPSIGAHPNAPGGAGQAPANPGAFDTCVSQLSTRFHEVVTLQPASRYWAFQWSETAIFVALALILAAFCFWWINHRLT